MPRMSAPSLHSLPALLDAAFALWWRSLPFTAPMALIGALPGLRTVLQLPTLTALQSKPDATALAFIEPLTRADTWLLLALGWLFALWLHTAQALVIERLRQHAPAQPLAALGQALLRLPAVLGSTVIFLLLCALPLLPLLAFNAWLGLQALPLPALLGLGLIAAGLASVPICWVAVVYLFAPYCSALDGRAPHIAFTASRRLVHGRWWRMSLYLSIPLTIYAVAAFAAGLVPLLLAGGSLLAGDAAEPGLLARAFGPALMLTVSALGAPMIHACLIAALRESDAVRESDTRPAETPSHRPPALPGPL